MVFTTRLALATTACLALLGLVISRLAHPPDPALVLGLAVAGAVLEWTAVGWPGMGYSSSAPACYLALALRPSGLGWAGIALGVGVTLRGLTRGGPSAALRVREAVAGALPVALALAATLPLKDLNVGWMTFLLLDIYLIAAFLIPAWLAAELPPLEESRWRRMRARTVLSWLSVGFLAPPLAMLAPTQVLWLFPVLLGLQRSSIAAVEAVREEDRQRLQQELDQSRRSEQAARGETARVRRELEVKVEERALLEELAREFASAPDLESTLSSTVRMVLRLVPDCRSAAVFLDEEGDLVPVAFDSPERKRLEASRLLRTEEPIVTLAWREGREVTLGDLPDAGERLFPHELSAVALPLEGGVLYAGSARAPLGPSQLNLLRLLTAQAREALKTARRHQDLQVQAQDTGRLRQEVDQFAELLEATRALAASLEVEPLLDALQTRLQEMVPHHSCGLTLLSPPRQRGPYNPALVQAVLASGKPLLLEDAAASKTGPIQPGERSLVAVPMETESGAVGVIALGHREVGAFTRQHLDSLQVLGIQAALALGNAALHEQVQQSLVKLRESEAQLLQSSKMAAVGQLAAGVAHELNTPLGTITLALQSAHRTRDLPDGLRATLERAQQAAARAKDIVAKLLFYSRDARSGRTPARLDKVVSDTLDLLGQQLRLDGLQVQVEGPPSPTEVTCNQNEVQQVLINLLINARDALQGYPGHILVRLGGNEREAVVEVVDAGPGVPEEARSRIFDPFFTTKPVGKGTGLGLSVSRQIMESHGGSLEYEALNPGSLFRMRLPVEG